MADLQLVHGKLEVCDCPALIVLHKAGLIGLSSVNPSRITSLLHGCSCH